MFGYLRPDLETKVALAVPSFESGRELRLPSLLLSHERQRACGSLGSKSGQSLLTGGLAAALPPSSDFVSQHFAKFFFEKHFLFFHLLTEIGKRKANKS